MAQKLPQYRGVKRFKDILHDKRRQYGVKVLHHLPETKVSFPSFSSLDVNFPMEERKLIEVLNEYYGSPVDSRIYPDTYAASIEHGSIIGNSGMIITPDGHIIAETASLAGYADGRCHSIATMKKKIQLAYAGHISGNTLSIGNPNRGYAHHLIESFFSMIWFDGKDVDHILTAQGVNRDRINEFLDALGIPKSFNLSISGDQFITADTVSFFGPNSYFMLRPETLATVEDILVKPRRSKTISGKKFFFDTGEKAPGAVYRAISNDCEFKDYLKKEGFEIIDPASYDLNEKISLISQAEEIVALGGSGGYNALFFANPGTRIMLLTPGKDITSLYNNYGGNRVIPGYSDTPILPVYKEFCANAGRLLTLFAISTYSTSLIVQERGLSLSRFYLSPGNDKLKITDTLVNLDKFKRFYKNTHL